MRLSCRQVAGSWALERGACHDPRRNESARGGRARRELDSPGDRRGRELAADVVELPGRPRVGSDHPRPDRRSRGLPGVRHRGAEAMIRYSVSSSFSARSYYSKGGKSSIPEHAGTAGAAAAAPAATVRYSVSSSFSRARTTREAIQSSTPSPAGTAGAVRIPTQPNPNRTRTGREAPADRPTTAQQPPDNLPTTPEQPPNSSPTAPRQVLDRSPTSPRQVPCRSFAGLRASGGQ